MEVPLEDRVLLVVAYWRTNLTQRQLAPLCGVSKSQAPSADTWFVTGRNSGSPDPPSLKCSRAEAKE